ncbi:MAG: ROK family protein [Endomicrobia bacterium]|nr:ROK family protein [Endomicrobiia bacterium]
MKRDYVLGMDIGGTETKIGMVECINQKNFSLKLNYSIPTICRKENLKLMLDEIKNVVKKITKKYTIQYCGIGIAGITDFVNGIIIDAPNIMWRNLNLKKLLESYLNLKVVIDNDANLAALGVYFTEIKQNYPVAENILCFTLGTGVGGGIIINGELFHSKHFSSGELGHITIIPNGKQCGCGNYGCLERYVGSRWFVRNVIEIMKDNKPKTILYRMINQDFGNLTTEVLYYAAKKGDKFALSQWERYGRYLGVAISSLINILTPEVIVFTGGVANAYKFFLPYVKKEVLNRVWPVVKYNKKYNLAKMVKYHIAVKQNYGIIGAGILAYKTYLSK